MVKTSYAEYMSLIDTLDIDFAKKNSGRQAGNVFEAAAGVAVTRFSIQKAWIAKKAAAAELQWWPCA